MICQQRNTLNAQQKLVLLDGNGLAYRAFYALPPLKTSTGAQVNAVYGFTMMLMKIIEREEPDFIAVAFDKSRPTRRIEMFDEYKAHRQRMPEELREQFSLIEEVVRVFRIPIYQAEGYEADDCIATLVTAAEEKGYHTRIYSGDLDMLQLVTDRTEVVTTRRGISDLVIYNTEMVRKRYSIDPPQLVDYKALAGDSSDHIPGIPGIGEASASKLLNQFKDIETMYEETEQIPSRWKKQILENKDQAYLSKRLVSLEKYMDFNLDWDELAHKEPDRQELKKLFVSLEFKTLLKKLGFKEDELNEIQEIVVQIVGKDEDLDELLAKLKNAGSFSLFWVVDENCNLIGLAMGEGATNGYYFPFAIPDQLNITSTFGISPFSVDKVLHELKPFLDDPGIRKTVYNLKDGIRYLRRSEYFSGCSFTDVSIGAALLDPDYPPKSLETIFSRFTDFLPKTLEEVVPALKGKKKIKISEVPLQDLSLFISGRAVRLNGLGTAVREKLQATNLTPIFDTLEIPLIPLLAAVEERGVKIDFEAIQQETGAMTRKLENIAADIFKDAGQVFNINSTRQLQKILFEDLGISWEKAGLPTGGTSADTLGKLVDQHPIVGKILHYREVLREQSSGIDAIKERINFDTMKFHPTFHQFGSSSGRLVTHAPELGSLPPELRRIFIPSTEDKELLSFELAQLDMTLLAHFSEDEKLIDCFARGEDVHTRTASELFEVPGESVTPEMRENAKQITFSIISGYTSQNLAGILQVSRMEAKNYQDRFLHIYPGVANFIENSVAEAKQSAEVTSIMGRKRFLSSRDSKKHTGTSEKQVLEHLIRGSAADIMKKLLGHTFENILRGHRDIHLLIQTGDEMLFETRKRRVEKYTQKIVEIIRSIVPLKVPVKIIVKEGINWRDLKTKHIQESEKIERK